MTRTYEGTRLPNGTTTVRVDGQLLDCIGLRQASPTTFDWGYEGRGAPAQLALALLVDHFGDGEKARRHFEQLVRQVIRGLPSDGWVLTGADIDGALAAAG